MKQFTLLLIFLPLFLSSLFAQNQNEEEAYLGVHYNHVSKSKAKKLNFDNNHGAYVTKVVGNSAAAKNGIAPFDYLIGIDDNLFSEDQSFSQIMDDYNAGDQAVIHYIRNGQKSSKPITFGQESNAENTKINHEEEAFFGVQNSHNQNNSVDGVSVNIIANSTAEAMGMEDGDVINNINGYPIYDWHDLSTAIDNMKPGENIQVKYIRNETTRSGEQIIKTRNMTYNENHGTQYSYSYSYKNGQQSQDTQNNDATDDLNNEETTAEMPEVTMEDITEEEAEEMEKEAGVKMPVDNNLNVAQLNIFPNPNSGVFNLAFDLAEEGPTSIRIYDGTGRQIYQNDMTEFSGTFTERIDISNNPGGLYFLMISQNNKSVSKKVIIQ